MERFFTKTFTRFFIGFLVIITVALGLLIIAGHVIRQPEPVVDTTSSSQ